MSPAELTFHKLTRISDFLHFLWLFREIENDPGLESNSCSNLLRLASMHCRNRGLKATVFKFSNHRVLYLC